MFEQIDSLVREVSIIRQSMGDMEKYIRGLIKQEFQRRFRVKVRSDLVFGLHMALCVDTQDIWKQHRIRYFTPLLHDPTAPVTSLPWAYCITAMGGFDDCGLTWVPPAGSTVAILFENGDLAAPFYIGTTWQRTRAAPMTGSSSDNPSTSAQTSGANATSSSTTPGIAQLEEQQVQSCGQVSTDPTSGNSAQISFGVNVPEYTQYYQGHRGGYLLGEDETQVFPPWNTENYNGIDIDSIMDILTEPDAIQNITIPNIYGFKTPDKHMLKMVDGDPKCGRRWKRIELMSGCGNWMIFKDDHLHYCGQWSNCQQASANCMSVAMCEDSDGNPIEMPTCDDSRDILGGGVYHVVPDVDDEPISSEGADDANNAVASAASDLAGIVGGTGNQLAQGVAGANAGIANAPGGAGQQQTIAPGGALGNGIQTPAQSQAGNFLADMGLGSQLPGSENYGYNPYYKQSSECRPYLGPQTPQNNSCGLPQTGIQIMSISGHTMIFDDSVEEPQGDIGWESSTEPFDFGCTNVYTGALRFVSATGHLFEMDDNEDQSQIRGERNGIRLRSACGNMIWMRDWTVGGSGTSTTNSSGEQTSPNANQKMIVPVGETTAAGSDSGSTAGGSGPGCPPNVGGKYRGITLRSTSNHFIEMHDPMNQQCSAPRTNQSQTTSMAKSAYIRIKTGYGLRIDMIDETSQQNTENQSITILAPQKDNTVRGPHFMRFQEKPSGPGQIVVRAGGDYICMTYDHLMEVVGDKSKNPSDRLEIVSRQNIVVTNQGYINTADSHLFLANKQIFLLAGQDCCNTMTHKLGPCVFPVVYSIAPGRTNAFCQLAGIAASNRVYVTSDVSDLTVCPLNENKQNCASSSTTAVQPGTEKKGIAG